MIKHNKVSELLLDKQAKESRRITYKQMAIESNIPVYTVQRLIKKKNYQINYTHLLKLSDYFNCDIKNIVEYDDSHEPSKKRKRTSVADSLQKES